MGWRFHLLFQKNKDERKSWETAEVKSSEALKGFHSITLTLKDIKGTSEILTDVFGYKFLGQEGSRFRYVTDAISNASIVDLIEMPEGRAGINAAGTNHHVAFRVQDDDVLMRYREKIAQRGLNITAKINRDYFFSLYFREPGGVLFEIATDNPGFAIDESIDKLGSSLKLPKRYEASRAEIERSLPDLN